MRLFQLWIQIIWYLCSSGDIICCFFSIWKSAIRALCLHSKYIARHTQTDLASRKRERKIMTASQVLCLSCIWMELNLRWIMATMRSISLGEMGRVRDCSLSRFITWLVNSLQAWNKERERSSRLQSKEKTQVLSTALFWGDPSWLLYWLDGFIMLTKTQKYRYMHFASYY